MQLNVFQTKNGKVTFMANSNIPTSHYEGEKIGTITLHVELEKKVVTGERDIECREVHLYNSTLDIVHGVVPHLAKNIKITYDIEE
jgi:hypothetical protein